MHKSKIKKVIIFFLTIVLIGILLIGMEYLALTNVSGWKIYKFEEINISLKYPPTWIVKKTIFEDSQSVLISAKGLGGETSLIWLRGDYGGGCPPENQENRVIFEKEQKVCHYRGRLSPRDENWYVSTKTSNGNVIQLGVSIFHSNRMLRIFAQNMLDSFVYIK